MNRVGRGSGAWNSKLGGGPDAVYVLTARARCRTALPLRRCPAVRRHASRGYPSSTPIAAVASGRRAQPSPRAPPPINDAEKPGALFGETAVDNRTIDDRSLRTSNEGSRRNASRSTQGLNESGCSTTTSKAGRGLSWMISLPVRELTEQTPACCILLSGRSDLDEGRWILCMRPRLRLLLAAAVERHELAANRRCAEPLRPFGNALKELPPAAEQAVMTPASSGLSLGDLQTISVHGRGQRRRCWARGFVDKLPAPWRGGCCSYKTKFRRTIAGPGKPKPVALG